MHGTTLAGRYRLTELVGAGGMGQVWRAVDERLGRQVAVKVLARPHDEDQVLRLDSEARAAAALCDPHVVAVHDIGEALVDGGRVLYLVMELVEGWPLSQVLAVGLPALSDVVAWGEQICRGLHAAHTAGVVHRDIKPANILLTADGRVKVCDFGIARRADALGHSLTGTGAVIGTPSYMSPEQARADATIGPASDLYSLGCLLYELLTGTPPFPGGGWPVLNQHLNQIPAPVRSNRPEVPIELDHLVAELLHKETQLRPADAAEVARRLQALPVSAGADTGPAVTPVPRSDAQMVTAPTTVTSPVPAAPTVGGGVGGGLGRSASWRAGTLTGVLVGGQLILFAPIPGMVSGLLGLVAGVCVAAGSRLEAGHTADGHPHGSILGVSAAMLIAAVTMVALLGWSPAPWWAALLTGTVTGPIITAAAAAMRTLIEQVFRRSTQEAELATSSGLVSGAVGCALAAASVSGPLTTTVALGAGAWAASSLVIAMVLPVSHRGCHPSSGASR
ncbi:protein kinase [Streptomyces xiamenensis]|uniref:serine/threonine-protein kinase n=1 Tax=Streptomyces xiamenensis TaxID=408015 RepID=UPI0036E1D7D7